MLLKLKSTFQSLFALSCLLYATSLISAENISAEKNFIIGSAYSEQSAIRIVGDKDYPPIEWLEDGKAKGIFPSFLPELSKAMKRPIEYRLMDWKAAQKAVLTGEADVLTVFSPTPERAPNYDFIPSFLNVEMNLFVRSDNVTIFNASDLAGKITGVTKASHLQSWLSRNSQAKLVEVSDHQLGFQQLLNGEIDALATTRWVGLYTLQKYAIEGVRIVEPALYTKPTHMGVLKGNQQLVDELTSALQKMEQQGSLEELQQRWAGSQIVFFTQSKIDFYFFLLVSSGLLIVCGFFLVSILVLRKQVKSRTKSLQHSNDQLSDALKLQQRSQQQLVQTEKLAALGTMVAGIAHELNTPIGVGVTLSSTLKENLDQLFNQLKEGQIKLSELNQLKQDSDEIIHLMSNSLSNAANLTNNFKQLAVDQSSMQRREFKLDSIVENVVSTLRHSFKSYAAKIEVNKDSKVELEGYPGALTQIITNLLANAFIHGFDEDQEGSISVRYQNKEDQILLVIEDTGRGIPEAHLKDIFDPFFTTRMGKGSTGLGLNIVYTLVTGLLGGQIEASNTTGARFEIEIPRIAPLSSSKGIESEYR